MLTTVEKNKIGEDDQGKARPFTVGAVGIEQGDEGEEDKRDAGQ